MGIAMIAIAALALALGAKEEELDDVYTTLGSQILPTSPAEAVEQLKVAIEKVQSR